MTHLPAPLKKLFQEKRECVIDFPDWLLSKGDIQRYRSMDGLALMELAGRDSIAAAIRGVLNEEFTDIIPTFAYTGTETGPIGILDQAIDRLKARLPHVRIHEAVFMGSPGFWQALNGKYIQELLSRFGFYTPCIGCHLYLHSIRIPLSLLLGGIPIISGERERHNGSVKINQTSEALESYQELAKGFGIRLYLPLRHISDGATIQEILGFQWGEGDEQLDCVLSGNYRTVEGTVLIGQGEVKRYLDEFAVPIARAVVASYIQGRVPNHLEIAAELLRSESG
jgi:hypothetical protein